MRSKFEQKWDYWDIWDNGQKCQALESYASI